MFFEQLIKICKVDAHVAYNIPETMNCDAT